MSIERWKRVVGWLQSSDTGISSLAICAVMTGQRPRPYSHPPLDRGDFGRCHRLLYQFPEWRRRLHRMTKVPGWSGVVAAWSELARLYPESPTEFDDALAEALRNERTNP